MSNYAFKSWRNELAAINNIEGLLVPGQEKALLVLASALKPHSTIVEIGSFKGRSTACFALGSRSAKIFAIDTFEGNSKDFTEGVQFTGSNFYKEFIYNINTVRAASRVRPLVGLSSQIGLTWNKQIDLLFVDGSHIYEYVKKDFELFFPWVKPGGLVLFHDVDPAFPGVKKAWNTLVKNNLSALSNVHTLYFGIKKGTGVTKNRAEKFIKNITEQITVPKVFIVIPVYNRLAYTKRCLKSLDKQTYKNFEVILIDDGSKDNTYGYIKRNYPQIIIIRGNGNWWWTKSMYVGVREAFKTAESGDYILTMNNDCYFDSGYLENAVKASRENQGAIVGSLILNARNHSEVIDAGVKISWKYSLIYGVADKISNNVKFYTDRGVIDDLDTLPGKGTIIPIEVFSKIRNFNYIMLPHYIADYEFFCRAKRNGFRLQVNSRMRLYNFAEQTGESAKAETKQNFKQVLHILFGRNSKNNTIDFLNFIILCCPREYLGKNLAEAIRRPANYIPILHKMRLFFHNMPIYLKQNSIVSKTKLLVHNFPILIRQNRSGRRIRLLLHYIQIYYRQNRFTKKLSKVVSKFCYRITDYFG